MARWGNNNLTNWLSGGGRNREIRDTRDCWDEVERAKAASALATFETLPAALNEVVYPAIEQSGGREPLSSFVVDLALIADDLLFAEHIGDGDPLWSLIETDVSAAVEFRDLCTRRNRWARDFDGQWGVFRRQLVAGYSRLISALPEPCFDAAPEGEAFTVALSSLIENPAEIIEDLLRVIYDPDVLRHDLFKALRTRLSANMAAISGLPTNATEQQTAGRLIFPSKHKSESAAELVDLYLGGTPLERIFDLSVPFHVPEAIRFEHCHIIGGTGHGKTQLLQRMIHADLVAAKEDGRSVVVIDSQGDLIQKLLRLDLFSPEAPDSLADRLVLIDPSDVEYPPSLNLFEARADRLAEYSAADRERALNGLIELYETFFGALLGAELTQKQGVIFRYLARLMIAIPGATIHTLMHLMEDSRPFKSHMEKLDGSARHFFATEFNHPSFSATKKQILKRLWGVLSTPAFERMFAQAHNKVDLFTATNDGKIILINTAKDLFKTEGSALFGRFFIAMLAQATLERSVLPEWRRTPTFVYVDEAQEYFDDTIETLLNQARKYRVSIAAAHQTLDQLSPRLRAAFLANTSLKCAGGVSSRDARAIASELHTTPEFIEGMRRRRTSTEFAVWLKHRTPRALQLDVPLGFLERQPTLSEEAYDELIARNRDRYCGTLDTVLSFEPLSPAAPSPPEPIRPAPATREDRPEPMVAPPAPRPPVEERELGKGGPKHRYLQSLVKELAEQQGFRATIEAPLPSGAGQIDVLLERDGVAVAIEISVSTPAEHERENVRKCLDAGYARVGLVLAKSRTTQGKYRSLILETLSAEERDRVSFLAPEDLPDYIAALAPAPEPSETFVKGYRVRVSHSQVSPDDAKARRDQLAQIVARSLREAE